MLIVLRNPEVAPCICGTGMARHNWVAYDYGLEPLARLTFCTGYVRLMVQPVDEKQLGEGVSQELDDWWQGYLQELRQRILDNEIDR